MAQDVSREGHGLPNTSWSEVDVAKDKCTPEGQLALDAILERYRPALLAHLRAKFHLSPEDAEDTFQGFVQEKIIVRNFMARAEPSRGRFRTFLLSSLDRYAISQIRRNQALKRNPGTDLLPLHEMPEADLPFFEPDAGLEFEMQWSCAVLTGTLLNMRNDCLRKGRELIWQVFYRRVLLPILADADSPAYEELVEEYKIDSPSDAFNLLGTAKRMFERHLKEVVHEYIRSDHEVEEEIAHLRHLIGRKDSAR